MPRNNRKRNTATSPRKSQAEARIERMTAILLVGVFAIIYIAEQRNIDVHNALVPFAGGVILFGSSLYQYGQKWRVSPWTWVSGTILLMLAIYNIVVDPSANFFGVSLLIFAIVLTVGLFTGET